VLLTLLGKLILIEGVIVVVAEFRLTISKLKSIELALPLKVTADDPFIVTLITRVPEVEPVCLEVNVPLSMRLPEIVRVCVVEPVVNAADALRIPPIVTSLETLSARPLVASY
jgi:hypothetical protein